MVVYVLFKKDSLVDISQIMGIFFEESEAEKAQRYYTSTSTQNSVYYKYEPYKVQLAFEVVGGKK